MSLYKAQCTQCQRSLKFKCENGDLPRDACERVKVKTLDDAQGDEADIVFVDYTAVSHPGFTTARINRYRYCGVVEGQPGPLPQQRKCAQALKDY